MDPSVMFGMTFVFFLEKKVAEEILVDIIVAMNGNRTVCSTFTAVISLSLLLRRLAQ
jgi:hypothetical protein